MEKEIKTILEKKKNWIAKHPEDTPEYYKRVDGVDFKQMGIPQLENLLAGIQAGQITDDALKIYKSNLKKE